MRKLLALLALTPLLLTGCIGGEETAENEAAETPATEANETAPTAETTEATAQ
jgi:hypothetical protein